MTGKPPLKHLISLLYNYVVNDLRYIHSMTLAHLVDELDTVDSLYLASDTRKLVSQLKQILKEELDKRRNIRYTQKELDLKTKKERKTK